MRDPTVTSSGSTTGESSTDAITSATFRVLPRETDTQISNAFMPLLRARQIYRNAVRPTSFQLCAAVSNT